MKRPSPSRAFTLVEMLVVMVIIAILTSIILALNGTVQTTAARNKAAAQIKAMSAACEAYKADNGGYPQDANLTDTLDPVSAVDPTQTTYTKASLFLWQQLSGHLNDTNPTVPPTGVNLGTNYASDIFTDTMFSGTKNGNGRVTNVLYLQDPFGNSYGYSTAGLSAEQAYKAALIANGSGNRTSKGFNPTFDMWSTAGATKVSTNGSDIHNKWVKNW